jgi:hypothetical protein
MSSRQERVDRNAVAERLFALDEPASRPQFSAPWAEDEQSGRIQVYEPGLPRLIRKSKKSRARQPAGSAVVCSKSLRALIYERDAGICQLCAEIVVEPSIDRIIPGSLGGLYVEDNCQLACSGCNGRKGSLLVLRFAYASRVRRADLKSRGLI